MNFKFLVCTDFNRTMPLTKKGKEDGMNVFVIGDKGIRFSF